MTPITINLAKPEMLDAFDTVTHFAYGDGTTGTSPGQTTLANELGRNLITTTTKGSDTYDYVGRMSLADANTKNISEIGFFDAASGGNMAIRILLPTPILKDEDDELIFNVTLTVDIENA